MSKSRFTFWGMALPAVLLFTGCGGAGTDSGPSRGEGNIPIGRIQAPQILLSASEGVGQLPTRSVSVDPSGTLWTPSLPTGSTNFTFTTTSGTTVLPVVLAQQQSYVIDATLNAKPAGASVTAMTLSLAAGQTLAVGSTNPVNFVVTGTNVAGFRPNVWVDNGVGYFDANHNFIASVPGSGVIRAELFGFTAALPITVH